MRHWELEQGADEWQIPRTEVIIIDITSKRTHIATEKMMIRVGPDDSKKKKERTHPWTKTH